MYSENRNCDRKWSGFQTPPNITTCLACLQACNQPQMKVTLPASGLQEKTMRSRRGPGTKPAGKHNHHHSPYHSPPISSLYFCTGRGAVALHLSTFLQPKTGPQQLNSSSFGPNPLCTSCCTNTQPHHLACTTTPPLYNVPNCCSTQPFFQSFSYWFSVIIICQYCVSCIQKYTIFLVWLDFDSFSVRQHITWPNTCQSGPVSISK